MMVWQKLRSMPRLVKLVLGYILLAAVSFIPFVRETLFGRSLFLLIWTPILFIDYVLVILPDLIFNRGEIHLLLVILVCMFSTMLLRSILPETSKYLAWLWPLICFMMGNTYSLFLYSDCISYIPIVRYYLIPFTLCMVPAALGLGFGKLLCSWKRRTRYE